MNDLAKLAKQIREKKDEISELNKEVKQKKEVLQEMEGDMIGAIKDSGLEAVNVDGRRYSVKDEQVPVVEDWDGFYGFIKENDAFYLLQRRVSTPAFREAIGLYGEDGLPGVAVATLPKLDNRKV